MVMEGALPWAAPNDTFHELPVLLEVTVRKSTPSPLGFSKENTMAERSEEEPLPNDMVTVEFNAGAEVRGVLTNTAKVWF